MVPLREPFGILYLGRFALEHLDELAADDLALLLGVRHAFERRHELCRGVHEDHLDTEILREGLHHLLGFVESQQSGVDEHAGQLLADRPMDQRCRDRRVDAAGQPENDFFAADLRLDVTDRLFDIVRHVPVGAAAPRSRAGSARRSRGPAACA